MSKSEQYVADLLAGRFDPHSTKGTDTGVPLAFDVADLAVVSTELDAHRMQLATLRDRLAKEPQAVLDDFRGFFHDPDLTIEDLEQYLDAWQLALDDPDAFVDAIENGIPSFGIGAWLDRVRAYLHAPKDLTNVDAALVAEVLKTYDVQDQNKLSINPNVRRFEKFDPAWVPLLGGAIGEWRGKWPNLANFIRHEASPSGFVYPAPGAYPAGGLKIGLMADFGTGYYHSQAIASQLARWGYPYVFHLGDVYYAGRPEEFRDRFEAQLAPVIAKSKFFGLAENHELYSGGSTYQAYFKKIREAGHTPQEGSYFCVPFEHHQVIGLDVNWLGRQRFADDKCRAWLTNVLASSNGKTNILLTGSAPYAYGSPNSTQLLADLWDFVRNGQIHLWFWGDDHYCALFQRHATRAPFIGSCIGHGGYPGSKYNDGATSWVPHQWVETETRFPEWTKLRPDMGNNGWCEATLLADGGVELLYVDWLASKRHRVVLSRLGDILQPTIVNTFGGRADRATVPTLHRK